MVIGCEGEKAHTTHNVHINHSHSEIVHAYSSIDTSSTDLRTDDLYSADTISGLLKNLNRLCTLTLTIPQPHRRIETPYSAEDAYLD